MDVRTSHPKADSNLLCYLPRLLKPKQKTMKLLLSVKSSTNSLLALVLTMLYCQALCLPDLTSFYILNSSQGTDNCISLLCFHLLPSLPQEKPFPFNFLLC